MADADEGTDTDDTETETVHDDTDDTGTETDRSTDASTTDVRTLKLAKWTTRFGAWLIDVVLVGAVLSAVTSIPGYVTPAGFVLGGGFLETNGLGMFLYWTLTEGYSGQSAGKMVLDIRVTGEAGEDISWAQAAIQSFGKAFLLPLDALVGWLLLDGEYVRLFNRLSDTIVVETEDRGSGPPPGVEYEKPGG